MPNKPTSLTASFQTIRKLVSYFALEEKVFSLSSATRDLVFVGMREGKPLSDSSGEIGRLGVGCSVRGDSVTTQYPATITSDAINTQFSLY